MTGDELIAELKRLYRSKAYSHFFGGPGYQDRWMPAVLVRKALLWKLIKALEAKR